LLEKGCDEFQGYFLGRPVGEPEFRQFLERAGELREWLVGLALPDSFSYPEADARSA
jgi:hypothetical protein